MAFGASLRIDIAELRTGEGKLHLFVAASERPHSPSLS
jgi:hypothetical protein